MVKQIGVIGYECEDIIIYLAGIFNALGKRTVIVDRSEQELLCEMLGMPEGEERTVREREYCGIWVSNQGGCVNEYDVVFYLFGYRWNHPKVYECEKILMITDGVPAHASLLKKANLAECQCYLLIRNLMTLKHKAEYLAELADRKSTYIELLYDEKDIRQRCSLNEYGRFEIKRLSAGMKSVLLEIMSHFMSEYPKRIISEAMKKM